MRNLNKIIKYLKKCKDINQYELEPLTMLQSIRNSLGEIVKLIFF